MRTFLNHKLHVSWLVAWFAAALIGGLALSYWVNNSFFLGWAVVIAAITLIFIAFMRQIWAMVLLVIVAGLLLGLWRGTDVRLANGQYQKYVGQTVQVQGTIADDVTHSGVVAKLKLKAMRVGRQKIGGEVWASTPSRLNLQRGDVVILTGKLQPGFGPFAASLSYAKITTALLPTNSDWLVNVRDKFASGLNKALPASQALLGLGYLTGQHNNLPESLTQQMQQVGLIHLVLAGGYNVTILIQFARRGFNHASKYLALMASGTILLGLTFMSGFSAPMARTAIVTGMCLAAWYYGRKIHPLVLLPIAAAITAVIDPTFVWGDVGWYLTFVAYGGLILLAPMLGQLFWPNRNLGTLKQIFVDTLTIQLVTMPLLAFAFGQYSIYGLPANLLVLPLMPLTMLFTAIAGLGGMVLPVGAAHVVGWPASILLGYTYKITTWLAGLAGANLTASITVPLMAIAYAALLVFVYSLWRKSHYEFSSQNLVE